jgi:beta-galactosidase
VDIPLANKFQHRTRKNIDFDWRFCLGDAPSAEQPKHDDSAWRTVDLPHDWSIEGEYAEDHPSGKRGGFLPAGIGWYRKTFDCPEEWLAKKVFVEFDGIYMNSDVWINGHHLGHRPNGYIGFEYDLTPYLQPGGNVIAVRADATLAPSGRWYTGCGIYRHVRITLADPVRVAHWGTYVTTPEVSDSNAKVAISTTLRNDSAAPRSVTLISAIVDAERRTVCTAVAQAAIPAGAEATFSQNETITAPNLWSPEKPYLYTLHTTVKEGDAILDEYETPFGVRHYAFHADRGFEFNGRPMKLQGICHHHDAGPVGAAVPDKVLERRLRLLKSMGCNAIRTGHHPMAPEFYELCDTIGFFVVDEAFDGWSQTKATGDYGLYFDEWWRRDLRDIMLRDRNHPSIILWSLGNEVPGKTDEQTTLMQNFVHEIDPTRPVTCGRGEDGILDVQGYNGHGGKPGVLEEVHANHPHLKIILTEEPHTFQTRGFYRTQTWWRDKNQPRFEVPNLTEEEIFFDGALQYNSSYDNSGVRNSARNSWRRTRDLPFVGGEFRWTGFDYLGESFGWPARMANFGILDLCGFPKDHYFLYQSLWTSEPMIHLLPHWTHPGKEGVTIPVWVYTNCERAELFLNGKSFGVRSIGDEMYIQWDVPYEPGELKAVGYKGGKQLVEKVAHTAAAAYGIRLEADNVQLAEYNRDVSHVAFSIVDRDGHLVPHAADRVTFHLRGPVRNLGLDNGDPLDLSPHKVNERKAFYGMGMGIFQSTLEPGDIELTAAGILGETLFDRQTQVAIAVSRAMLRGEAAARAYTIRYTLDGTEPDGNSPLYTEPFVVTQACTVRAAIECDGERLLSLRADFAQGVKPKVIDLTHGNRKAAKLERPVGPFAEQIVGEWSSEGQTLIFAADGTLSRHGVYGGKKEPLGFWWYDYPADPFETPDDAGKGEIWWSDGKVSGLALKDQTAEVLRIASGSTTLVFEKCR